MTEAGKNNKYIICSDCRCKYVNDEEHINKDFGYTRLEGRYKTCVKCRAREQTTNKKNSEKAKECYEAHNEEKKEYRENNADKRREYDRERNTIKTHCTNCSR